MSDPDSSLIQAKELGLALRCGFCSLDEISFRCQISTKKDLGVVMDLAEGASLAASGDGTSVGASQTCDVASLRKVCQQVNPSGPKAQGNDFI